MTNSNTNPSLISTTDESSSYEQSYNRHIGGLPTGSEDKPKGVFGRGDRDRDSDSDSHGHDRDHDHDHDRHADDTSGKENAEAREKRLNATRIPESGGMVMGLRAGDLLGEQQSSGGKSDFSSDEKGRAAQGYGKCSDGAMREDIGA